MIGWLIDFFYIYFIYFLNIFNWLCYYSCPIFTPLYSSLPYTPLPPSFPHLSSCPWVIYISSLASPFLVLFLTSPCIFCTYQLCFLFLVPFPQFSSFTLLTDNPPHDLHFCDSVPVLVVCVFDFLGSIVDSCQFVVILLFIFLVFFYFLGKSLQHFI